LVQPFPFISSGFRNSARRREHWRSQILALKTCLAHLRTTSLHSPSRRQFAPWCNIQTNSRVSAFGFVPLSARTVWKTRSWSPKDARGIVPWGSPNPEADRFFEGACTGTAISFDARRTATFVGRFRLRLRDLRTIYILEIEGVRNVKIEQAPTAKGSTKPD
jgi:hypothetical protein